MGLKILFKITIELLAAANKYQVPRLKEICDAELSQRIEMENVCEYWERAEVKQRKSLNKSNLYEIDFLVRFVEGFNGNRENFFQIHQSNDGCRISPVIMLKFSEGTMLGEWTFNISENKGKWINFNILLYPATKNMPF